jgi:hypothetical protein
MSNRQEIQLASAGRPLPKKLAREMARLDGQTELTVAAVRARADVQSSKVDAVISVGQRAMQGVAFLSQVEQQLGQTVPLSVTRLQAIGDLTTLGVGEIVTDTITMLRSL